MIALFCAVALGQVHPVPEEPNLEELLALCKQTEASYWKAVDRYDEHYEEMEAIINESFVPESHLEKLRATLETFRQKMKPLLDRQRRRAEALWQKYDFFKRRQRMHLAYRSDRYSPSLSPRFDLPRSESPSFA